MSRFRSLMGAAGAAAAGVASKYVDDEIATNRAKLLADLQVQTAGRLRQQEYDFENDPTRVAAGRERKRGDLLAAGAAAREVELAGLLDEGLRGAKRKLADEEFDAETGRKVRGAKATLAGDVEREGLMAEARAKAQAKYREPRAGSEDVAKKIAAIEKVLGRPLTEAEKLQAVGLIKPERNPELDTVDIEETTFDPKTGKETKTRRREVRRPGEKTGGAPDPFADIAAKLPPKGEPAKAASAAAPKPAVPRETNPIRLASNRDLQRIAAIEGHANQKAARDELARRASEAQSEESLMEEARTRLY